MLLNLHCNALFNLTFLRRLGFLRLAASGQRPSVQGALEDALGRLLREPVRVTGTGRTDTMVNAVGYVAHFDSEKSFDAADLCYKLNAILPRGIAVHSVAPADASFHARVAASQRKYTYFLHRLKDPFAERYSLRYPYPLDVDAMNRAAALLVGCHDFSCFQKVGSDVKSPVCTVREAFWAPYRPSHVALMGFGEVPGQARDEGCGEGWTYLDFRISADRFLRNMVRAIVGTLLDVGRGRRSVEDFASLVLPATSQVQPDAAAGSMRSLAGESVPGHALFFSGVEY